MITKVAYKNQYYLDQHFLTNRFNNKDDEEGYANFLDKRSIGSDRVARSYYTKKPMGIAAGIGGAAGLAYGLHSLKNGKFNSAAVVPLATLFGAAAASIPGAYIGNIEYDKKLREKYLKSNKK